MSIPNLRFRKKPVVIEAFQMTPERRKSNEDWPAWMHEAWNSGALRPFFEGRSDGRLVVDTLEGAMVIDWGDWVIRGVKGEIYPCKPDIFAATYEEVQ